MDHDQQKDLIGVELAPGFVAHVAGDVSAETVEALRQMGQCLLDAQPLFIQPGDADQLARTVHAAERYYESSRQPIVVYWSSSAERYRIDYVNVHRSEKTIEVVRIPK